MRFGVTVDLSTGEVEPTVVVGGKNV